MNKMLESTEAVYIYTHNTFYKRTKKGKNNCLYKKYI